MLQNFFISKYNFVLRFLEKALLPPYKGSTLRGAFGVNFRKVCCIQRSVKDCNRCLLRQSCPFIYIFNSSPPPYAKKLRRYDNIPRPFLIFPPLDEKREYSPGENLSFQLTLIGDAVNYLPYIILTFKEMGKLGIGKKVNGKRGTFELSRVDAISPNENGEYLEIYSSSNELIHNKDVKISHSHVMERVKEINPRKIKIDFISPLRLRYEGSYIRHPEFHHLVKAAIARLSSLSYFYCHEELKVDFKRLIHNSFKVKLISSSYCWQDWWRYSSRQGTKIALGGVVGEAIFEGELEAYLPFLVWGELIHIGKGTTFGLGKYTIESGKPTF